jgi:hypothetical protein
MSEEADSAAYLMIAFCSAGQRVELALVEDDLEAFGRLVEALQHVELRDVLEAEQGVRRRVVELRAVDDAALQRRHDFATRQDGHGRAHFLSGRPQGRRCDTSGP